MEREGCSNGFNHPFLDSLTHSLSTPLPPSAAINGEKNVSECAFVESSVVPGVPFFSTRITLGKEGVVAIAPTGPLSDYEKAGLDKMIPELKASIDKGVEFAKKYAPKA